MKRGALIVFEGLDGCGKSTQLRRAAKSLTERGFELTVTGAEAIFWNVISTRYEEKSSNLSL